MLCKKPKTYSIGFGLVKIIKGSLFDHPGHVICHGVNCKGVFGKGIAVSFKKRFPDMYLKYRSLCKEGKLNQGMVLTWIERSSKQQNPLIIYNLAIKSHWKFPASYQAIETTLGKMLSHVKEKNLGKVIAMPWIGCGLGGLEKDQVLKIIKKSLKPFPEMEVWIYEI